MLREIDLHLLVSTFVNFKIDVLFASHLFSLCLLYLMLGFFESSER